MPRGILRDERGIALVAVIMIAFIMLALVAATTGFAVSSLDGSKHDQDWNAALAAAEAGIDDYLYRLNRDSEYWVYDATNLPEDGNAAFTGWVSVPASSTAQYRYGVDASQINGQGIVRLVSSGKVNGVVRTVEALLRRRNFLDFLYFTEFETRDPAAYTGIGTPGTNPSPTWAAANCNRHYYDNPGRTTGCQDISFIGTDVIKGPLHTNDALLLSGSPQFQGETSTSWDGTCPGGTNCVASANRFRGSSATPVVAFAGDPHFAAPLAMPPSNQSIRSYADQALGGEGCLFTGPTAISMNSDGTMDIISPLTKSSNCQTGLGRPPPDNGVIYIQSVPASSSDPNNTATCPVTLGNPLGYPQLGDINTSQYGCFDGDAFVRGTLKGDLTIAAQDSIIITGNITYEGGTGGNDLLGLVADNYVEIYHPVNTSGQNLVGSLVNVTVHAAILTVKHSFRVQTYFSGPALGVLSIFGSLGQLYRGAVGTFSGTTPVTGYSKDYTYDQKLRYRSPPHFLDPVASAWGVKTWAECAPQADPTAC